MSRVIIVGAGQAAVSLAVRLRTLGHQGPITLYGEEPVLPYERPPLSKAYLLGKLARERLYLRTQDFYDRQAITVVTGRHVDSIDRQRCAICVDGRWVAYDMLALATGSLARRLPSSIGGDLPRAHVVRTLADVDMMAKSQRVGGRALVVGGGYIGLEAAAVLRQMNMEVTLLETASRILQRVAAPQTSDYFRRLHQKQGVEIREGTGLERLIGPDHVTRAVLSDASELDVDAAIVGIGVDPGIALAAAAGLATDNGVAVDSFGRTSDPAIWAAGDCTSFPYRGRRIRLESVQNAIDQASVVAENMLGAARSYLPVPWFWSDQYNVKLQIAGLGSGYDQVVVRDGAKDGSVSHWYFNGAQLLAVDAMNDPRSFMLAKRLLETDATVDPIAVADPSIDLKELLAT